MRGTLARTAPLLLSCAALAVAFAGCASRDVASTDSNDVVSGPPSAGGAAAGSPGSTTATSTSPSQDPAIASLANIGDSISQGFDADDSDPIDIAAMLTDSASVFHDMPTLSWIQGTDPRIGSVMSHYRAQNPQLVEIPVSHTGAELVGRGSTVPNFEQQARMLAGKSPELVYVLLGGNDVCNRETSTTTDATEKMYSIDEWRAGAQAGLAALVDVLPAGATVRFLSMPRVDLLVEKVADAPIKMTLASGLGNLAASPTCHNLWIAAESAGRGICPIVTLEGDADRRKAIGVRIDQYNDALAAEVRSWNGDATKNPKKITFQSDWHGSIDSGQKANTSVGTFIFEESLASKRDCFHPSILGQQTVASVVLKTSNFTSQ